MGWELILQSGRYAESSNGMYERSQEYATETPGHVNKMALPGSMSKYNQKKKNLFLNSKTKR